MFAGINSGLFYLMIHRVKHEIKYVLLGKWTREWALFFAPNGSTSGALCVYVCFVNGKLFKLSSEDVWFCICMFLFLFLFGVLLLPLLLLLLSLFLFIMRNSHLDSLQFWCICFLNDSLLAYFYRIVNCFCSVWFGSFCIQCKWNSH